MFLTFKVSLLCQAYIVVFNACISFSQNICCRINRLVWNIYNLDNDLKHTDKVVEGCWIYYWIKRAYLQISLQRCCKVLPVCCFRNQPFSRIEIIPSLAVVSFAIQWLLQYKKQFHNSILDASMLLLPCHWEWDVDYDDEEAQADGHDAEESSQPSQSPSPVHVPVLQAVPGHNGEDQCHNADGPHGAKAGEDDQDEVVLGFGCLLDSGITGGGAAQAGPGWGQGSGCRQVSSRTGPHRNAVSILVGVKALVSTRVERSGRLHAIAPWFSGNCQ